MINTDYTVVKVRKKENVNLNCLFKHVHTLLLHYKNATDLLPRLGLVVVPFGVAVDQFVSLRGHVAQRPVPVRHPVR